MTNYEKTIVISEFLKYVELESGASVDGRGDVVDDIYTTAAFISEHLGTSYPDSLEIVCQVRSNNLTVLSEDGTEDNTEDIQILGLKSL